MYLSWNYLVHISLDKYFFVIQSTDKKIDLNYVRVAASDQIVGAVIIMSCEEGEDARGEERRGENNLNLLLIECTYFLCALVFSREGSRFLASA